MSLLQSLTAQLPAVQAALLTVIWVVWVPTMKLAASAAGCEGWLASSNKVVVVRGKRAGVGGPEAWLGRGVW